MTNKPTRAAPSPEALARLRTMVGGVLGALVAVTIVLMVLDAWPVPWIDALGIEWFGRTSLRWRFVGTFVVLGAGILLPALLLALVVKRIFGHR